MSQDTKKKPSLLYRFLGNKYVLASLWGYALYQHGFFTMVDDFLMAEEKHYKASEYTQDPARIDNSTIEVRGPDFDTHIFEGFKGLSKDEAQSLVDAHYYNIEDPYKIISQYHYLRPEYNQLIDGFEVPEIAAKLNPEADYSPAAIEFVAQAISESQLAALDSHTRIKFPDNRNLTTDDVEAYYSIEDSLVSADIKDIMYGAMDVSRDNVRAMHAHLNTKYNDYENVQSAVFDERVLYLEIPHFQDNIYSQTVSAIKQAQTKYPNSLEAIFIDVRDTPGGYAHETYAIIDALTNETDLGLMKHGPVYTEHVTSELEQITSLPISIFINNESASAAEIFAGSLQGLNRAKVFGKTPSYGKAISQINLSRELRNDDIKLTLTASSVFLPQIGSYQGLGIQPDVLVNMTPRDHKYGYIYMKDYPNHIPNPEGKTVLAPAPYSCKVDFDYAKGEKQAWYHKDNLSTGKSYNVNLGYDETMLCALDDLEDKPKYSITKPNIPSV